MSHGSGVESGGFESRGVERVDAVRCLAGLFVGGKSSRMGGKPKGTLRAPDGRGSLVERLCGELRGAGLDGPVLVGSSEAYRYVELPTVVDVGSGTGPLGGFAALAQFAVKNSFETVVTVACDMPYVDRAFLRRLATEYPKADALVPRRQYWEPLCARYRARALEAVVSRQLELGRHRLGDLIEAFGDGVVQMALSVDEERLLRDWDSPSDIASAGSGER